MQQASEQSSASRVGERAYRCYQELIAFIDEHGYVPSYEELGERIGRAPSTVSRYLARLEAEGLVTRVGRRARSVVVKLEPPLTGTG